MYARVSISLAGALAVASILAARPAAAATSTPMRLHNKKQNLCLDPPGKDGGWPGGSAVGVVARCTAERDTYFVHTAAGELRNELKGYCLDNGARLAVCDGTAEQRWTVVPKGGGWFAVKNAGGGCLMGMSNGVDMANCDATADESLWTWGSTGMALLNTHEVERKIVADGGLCLGIAGGSTADGAAIVQADCGSSGARWQLVNAGAQHPALGEPLLLIKSRHSGLCLDVPGGSDLDGVAAQQRACSVGSAAQRFMLIDDAGRIRLTTGGGKCLEFAGDAAGAKLVRRTCAAEHFASRQRFTVTGRRPQRVRNSANGLCLDRALWAGGDGPMGVAPCDDGRDQLFVRNTDWELVSLAQAKCLDVTGTAAASGAQVNLYKCENADDQRWTFAGSNAEIRNKRSGLCLDLPGYVGKVDDPVKLYTCDGGQDQKWSWDDSTAVVPPPPPQTLAFSSAGDGENQVCAPWGRMCVRGAIAATGGAGLYKASGTVKVATPLGAWELEDANLDIDLAAPKIAGSAKLKIPALGILEKIVGTAVQAEVRIGPGGGPVAIPGGTFARSPDRFYVYAKIVGQSTFKLGGDAGLTIDLGPGNVLLVDPSSPTVYLEGAAVKLVPIPVLNGFDALGFSLGQCFTRALDNEVRGPDGGERQRSVCGHLLASATLSYKLIAGTGTLVVDIDADRDGKTVFSGEPHDFRVAYDGAAQVDKAILDLPLGGATIYYDGSYLDPATQSRGRLELAGTGGRANLFAGTPLAPLDTGGVLSGVQISVDASRRDFWFRASSATILGWQPLDVAGKMTWNGSAFEQAEASARYRLPLGAGDIALAGTFKSASDWLVKGTAALTFHKLAKFAGATVTFSDDGMSLAGSAEFGGIAGFAVTGAFASPSSFSLKGSVKVAGKASFGMGDLGFDLLDWLKYFGGGGSVATGWADGSATLTIDQGGVSAGFKGKVGIDGLGSLGDFSGSIDSSGAVCFKLPGVPKAACVDLKKAAT